MSKENGKAGFLRAAEALWDGWMDSTGSDPQTRESFLVTVLRTADILWLAARCDAFAGNPDADPQTRACFRRLTEAAVKGAYLLAAGPSSKEREDRPKGNQNHRRAAERRPDAPENQG